MNVKTAAKTACKVAWRFAKSPEFIATLGILATVVKLAHQIDMLRRSERQIGFRTDDE